MKEYYYCLDGQTVDGPHSEGEMQELLGHGVLQPETQVCPAGEKEWISLSAVQFDPAGVAAPKKLEMETPAADQAVEVDHAAVAAAGSDKDEDAPEIDRGPGKYQLLKAIRADLDLLWKSQRESLISQIRGLELEPVYETTRKQAKEIKQRVKDAAMQYWHKAGAFEEWIEELVWKDCDIQRKLRGNGCEEKYQDAKQWLTEAKLIDEAGCYCFKRGKEYLYIGKAGMTKESTLGRRLKEHEHAVWFEQTTHLRIIIPRHKSWISKLERLLLLCYPESVYNRGTPTTGNNPADDIIHLLEKEMSDLLIDG